MNTRTMGSGQGIISRCVMAMFCLLMLMLSVDAMADTRRFQMALFGSSDPGYTDLSWLNPGEAQPAAPRRSILAIDGVYQNSNLASYLAGLGYDWSRIAAVVIDEPYWNAVGQNGDWSNPCWTGDWRVAAIDNVFILLGNAAAAVDSVSPSTRFWVNFSEPEVQWMMDACHFPFDQPYIDVISLDKYNVPFSQVKPYYDWLVANRPKQNQQFALVPGVFSMVAPNYVDPNWSASLLQGYFDYANNMNSVGWNSPMVWVVAGWPGLGGVLDVGYGQLWAGIFDPNSEAIASWWSWQFQKQRIDNMAGYMEVIDEYNGLIHGWAVDRTVERPPYVDFWVDGQYWGGTIPDQNRPDVGAVFDIYTAGFTFTIPPQFKDGGCHWVDAYVVAPEPYTGNYLMPTIYGSWLCFP